MKCEEGDLAMVICSAAGLEGMVVKCIQYYGNVAAHSLSTGATVPAPAWIIEPPLRAHGGWVSILTDSQLMPIRFHAGLDEMLQRTGYPPGRSRK